MNKQWKIKLENEAIASLVEQAEKEAERCGAESGQCMLFRISLEEMLLYCRDQSGADAEATLTIRRAGQKMTARLIVPDSFSDVQSDGPLAELRKRWKTDSDGHSRVYTIRAEGSLLDTLKFIWNYTRPHKSWLYLGIAVHVLRAAILIVIPLITARVIVSITSGVTEQIMLTAGSLLLIGMISGTVSIACNLTYNVVYNRTLTLLEEDLVHHVLKITPLSLEQKGTGVFLQRMTQDTHQLATSLSTLIVVLSQFFEKFGILIAILIVNRLAFLAAACILLVQIMIETARTRRLKADDHVLRNAEERYTGLVNEMIRGAVDVKLMHSESSFAQELAVRIRDANGKRLAMWNRSALFDISRLQLDSAGTYIFIAVIVFLLSSHSISPSSAIVLFNYRSCIEYTAIQLIGSLLQLTRETELSAERIIALIRSPEFAKEQFGEKHPGSLNGEIRFDHVFFSYDRSPKQQLPGWVLKDMSFVIHPGETVAITGASGCGKSTVFKLISKLYEPVRGTVLIDGTDVKELDADTLRGRIAVVNQDPYIFQLSIRDNLRLLKPDMTDEEMHRVCRMACIEKELEEKPDGFDRVIGENGINLSGGQKQRLAIARALLKEADILMLDESTSDLDNVTQNEIMRHIRECWAGRTVIIIAHRLSSVITADRILFVDEGRIKDEGTHQELLSRCEQYRMFYEAEVSKQ